MMNKENITAKNEKGETVAFCCNGCKDRFVAELPEMDAMMEKGEMMAEMGTPPSQVADVIVKAINSNEILPRYIVGTDAAMFMEAKQAKTDLEFEKYMSKELFPG